jgi:hypothetical protein
MGPYFPIEQDLSGVHFIQAGYQFCQRGFAAARTSDDRNRFSCLYFRLKFLITGQLIFHIQM